MSKKKKPQIVHAPIPVIAQEVIVTEIQQELLVDNSPGIDSQEISNLFTVKNLHRCTHQVFGKKLPSGKTYQITQADAADVRGMKKIENAILKGYLGRI